MYGDESGVLLEAGAVIAVIGSALALHVYVAPYEHRYQNRLETGLSVSGMVLIGLLCAMHECKHTFADYGSCRSNSSGAATGSALEATIVLALLSPVICCVGWCTLSGGRRTVTRERLRELLREAHARAAAGSSGGVHVAKLLIAGLWQQ